MRRHLLLTLWLLLLLVPCAPLVAEDEEDAEDALIEAGEEDVLDIPGTDFPCQLYVPSDFVPGGRLPLILFLHGSGGKPTSWPWKSATDGKGYLICGLSYGALSGGGHRGIQSGPDSRTAMVKFIEQVRALVDEKYGVDQRRVFLSGLSMGGWGVNFYGFLDAARGRYRGYCIMASGIVQSPPPDLSVLEGLPLMLLNGANDANLAAANRGAPLFKKAGAILTQEVLQDEGHVPSTVAMAKPLKSWLDGIAKADEQERALAAVRWTEVELDGLPEPARPTHAQVRSWLCAQPFLGKEKDKPILLFLSTDHADKKGAPSKFAQRSAQVDEETFGFPAALHTPAAARCFACFRASIGDVERSVGAVVRRRSAPMVLLLDRNRLALRIVPPAKLRDAALAKEMRGLLTEAERAAADARVATTKPLLIELRKLSKSIASEKKTLSKLRAKPAEKVRKKVEKHTAALEALTARYEEIRAKLAE